MQGHQALLVVVGGVAPAEGHLIIFKGGEPVIGDRNSMCVTAEIAEGMLGPAKRPFAIDHPLNCEMSAVSVAQKSLAAPAVLESHESQVGPEQRSPSKLP
jgi:hypothetical protein